jgi:hypothetical protein
VRVTDPYRPLFCGAASGLPEVPEAAYGFAGRLTLDIRSPRQTSWIEIVQQRINGVPRPGPALLSSGHVFGAMSSGMSLEFTASFGCRHFSSRFHPVCPTLVLLYPWLRRLPYRAPSRRRRVGASNGRNRKRRPSK